MKKALKVLGNPIVKWSEIGTIGLIFLSLVGGNFIASLVAGNFIAERREQEIEAELAAFSSKVTRQTDYNETAIALKTLSAQLGFNVYSWSEDTKSKFARDIGKIAIEPGDRKSWEAIEPKLKEYLNAQITKPSSEIDRPPPELQQYLKVNAKTIAQIREVVSRQGAPVWKMNLDPVLEGDFTFRLPSYLGIAQLQKVLALDILEKQRNGQTEAARSMLETTWQINTSLEDSPLLIGQLVNLINGRYIAGTMRKLGNLPIEWQQRLVDRDYSQSVVTSIQGEYFGYFNIIRRTPPKEIFTTVELFEYNPTPAINPTPAKTLQKHAATLAAVSLSPITKLWLRFSAIDGYQVNKKAIEQYQAQPMNVCASDAFEFKERPAFWNVVGQITFPSSFNQPAKGQKFMLDSELTQKVLQANALAAKTGQWPGTLPNLESSVCPGYTWVYQVAKDGTMSLSLSQEPKWAAQRLKYSGLPLTYRSRKLPDRVARY